MPVSVTREEAEVGRACETVVLSSPGFELAI